MSIWSELNEHQLAKLYGEIREKQYLTDDDDRRLARIVNELALRGYTIEKGATYRGVPKIVRKEVITMAEEEKVRRKGAFVESLQRNNKQIKDDRAEAIAEDAQLRYKRTVEDLEVGIKRLKRQRENMLDLSPENALSLMVAKDFDSKAFVDFDLDLGVKIRNEQIKLDIAKEQYEYLFGGK